MNIDASEFKDKGYLQEVNRLFFHQLGLAMYVGDDGSMGVLDYREDPDGIIFDFANLSEEDKAAMSAKATFIITDAMARNAIRMDAFGFTCEPLT